MVSFALQITSNDPLFWIMVIIAISFVVMAIAMVAIAAFVSRAVKAVDRLEHKMEPLIERVSVISDQGKLIAVQAKQISEQFNAMSGHLANATMYFSDSLAIIKGEVAELKELVSDTAVEARDKVELVSRTIDRTQQQERLSKI